ncbi:MAG: histidinol-phosphate transaminase [Gammaproteobacteria bacterium HGW-Gammaproteobacteria-3]|nr:MAG: histidinol-phosphate transaminase [Gammaproteobacteria bacterium HGW-Gammaproteobacteria-3]
MTHSNLIATVFRQEVLALSAYSVADASGLIKLDAMENPYHWPEPVILDWLESLKGSELNRYPDPKAQKLCATLRQTYAISGQFGLLLGNGSDEIIQLLLMALPPGAAVLAPAPGFVMYRQISRSLGLEYLDVALKASDFDLDLPAMLAAIDRHRPAIIFLAYPNNPSGNLFSEDAVLEIIQASSGLVVIDEAYAPFANAGFIDRLGRFDNLLVLRTLSKLGLAGLRLGYIAGNPAIIEQLDKIRLPYNINILTQITADFALRNTALFSRQTQAICNERAEVFKALSQFESLTVFPSAANFILFRTPENQATAVFEGLKSRGVLIKNLAPQGGLLKDCLRATIGTPDENRAFLKALRICLKQ